MDVGAIATKQKLENHSLALVAKLPPPLVVIISRV